MLSGESYLSRVKRAVPIVFLATMALFAAACGRGPASGTGGTDHRASTTAKPLAFSHCMRSHGVSTFPDPNSNGVWPKSQVESAANSPRYRPAASACGHLLPDGGPGVPPTPAVVRQIHADMMKFAHCMRAHGVSNWPDPTLTRGRTIFDPQAAGINTSAPQVSAKMQACRHVFPASLGIPPGA